MCEKQETDERHCIKTYIKERIRRGYCARIQSFISKSGRSLYNWTLRGPFVTIQIASVATVLTTSGDRSLSDFVNTEDSQNGDNEDSEIDNSEAEKSNKVLDNIDVDNWDVLGPHDSLPNDTEYGIVYGRYSSDNQEETGCVARVKSMLDKAEEMNVPLYEQPIVDVALSGKDSDREGLKRVVHLVQHPQINYFFVHDINRLARWNSFCIFLLDVFTRKFDIEIITDQGVLDLDRIEGLATTWVTSMSGEISNRNKAKNTLGGQIQKFEKGNYESWFKQYRVGYKPSEEKLVEVDESKVGIAKAIFRTFNGSDHHGPYADTCRKINSQYEPLLDEPLYPDYLKRMLTDPIYIGKPTVSGESIGDQGQELVQDKPELQIIDESLFESVNEKVEQTKKRYSDDSSPGEVLDLDYIMNEFGLLPVVESSPQVAIHCPECDEKMVRNGQYKLNGVDRKSPIYKCMSCASDPNKQGVFKTYPNSLEAYKIRLFNKVLKNIDKLGDALDLDRI